MMATKSFTGLIILLLSMLSMDVKAQNTNDYRKYEIEKGEILYEVLQSDTLVSKLRVYFHDYGAKEVYLSLNKEKWINLFKRDSIQVHLDAGSITYIPRSFNYFNEYFVKERKSKLYSGLLLAKPSRRKFLRYKCEYFYHFEFPELNDWRGAVAFYKGIPLFIQINSGTHLYEIKAVKFRVY